MSVYIKLPINNPQQQPKRYYILLNKHKIKIGKITCFYKYNDNPHLLYMLYIITAFPNILSF